MLLQRCRLVIHNKELGFLPFYSSIVFGDFYAVMNNKVASLLQLSYGLPMKCYFDAMEMKGLIVKDEVRSHSPKFSGYLIVNFYIPR